MAPETMSAARAALTVLEGAGIEVVYGNPGTTEIPIIKELASDASPIRYVMTLHEGTAVSAAIGDALASGRPGVALVHAMPGVANGLSQYFNAFRTGVPLVLIAGQQDRRHQFLNPILQADVAEVLRPVSKAAWEVKTPEEIGEVLARALKGAAAAPAGPVLISVPVDLWDGQVSPPVAGPVAARSVGPASDEDVLALCDLISAAESPVLVAGDGVGARDALGELAELAELAGAPTYWAPGCALANFPTTSPCFRGPIFPNAASFDRAFKGADLALFVGVELQPPILFSSTRILPAGCRVASLTESAAEPLGALSPDTLAYGDLAPTLAALVPTLGQQIAAGAAPGLERRRERVLAEGATQREKLRGRSLELAAETPLSGRAAIATVLDAAPPDVVVVDESVSNAWVSVLGEFRDPVSYLAPARGGALGHAFGVAVGAQIELPDRPVLVVVGDGAALYAIQGLWTIAHERLPVVTCVVDNGGYAILKDFLRSERFSPELAATPGLNVDAEADRMSIADPAVDAVGLARSLGVDAVRVEDAAACRAAVAEAFASGRPWLIDIPVRHDAEGAG